MGDETQEAKGVSSREGLQDRGQGGHGAHGSYGLLLWLWPFLCLRQEPGVGESNDRWFSVSA